MSWTSDGSLGATADKTAGTSIAHTVTATAEVGKVVLVAVGKDNAATADGNTNEVTSVTDNVGNVYTKAREFCNAQGAADTGATVALFYSVLTAQLSSGSGIITANFSDTRTAKAISCWELTIGSNRVVTVAGVDLAVDAGAPSSMTVTPGTSAEYLFVRVTASEIQSGGSWTPTSGFTALTLVATTGGVSNTNMRIGGEFHILTATGDTSLPTVGGSADHASVFVALGERTQHAGAATVSGAASLTAAAQVKHEALAAVAGAAALAAAGTVTAGTITHQGAAALTGAASLSAEARVRHEAVAALGGSGTLAAAAQVRHEGAAQVAGAASLTASAQVARHGDVSLSGTAVLMASSVVTHNASGALAGAGAVAAAAVVTRSAAALLAADGLLAASGRLTYRAGAALGGSATLTASGSVSIPPESTSCLEDDDHAASELSPADHAASLLTPLDRPATLLTAVDHPASLLTPADHAASILTPLDSCRSYP